VDHDADSIVPVANLETSARATFSAVLRLDPTWLAPPQTPEVNAEHESDYEFEAVPRRSERHGTFAFWSCG
jgi:hypothetical protein